MFFLVPLQVHGTPILSLKENDDDFINYIFDIDYTNVKSLQLISTKRKKS